MNRKNTVILFLFIYVITMAVFIRQPAAEAMSGDRLTALCLESSLPCMTLTADEETLLAEQEESEGAKAEEADGEEGSQAEEAKSAKSTKTATKTTKTKTKKKSGAPRVLIYHTHATESYLPTSSGNYHTTKEENTVRDVGNVLAETLEAEGIGVVHDKTLHDNPSYDSSYSRSYDTLTALLKEYPTVECIIDLHRDAMAGKGDGPVTDVNGRTAAVYSYVLSNTTETYGENKDFLQKLNAIAQESYGGYTGSILERPYWYNQEVSGKAILIEMGNNRNQIEDVRACAEIFGKILAEALE